MIKLSDLLYDLSKNKQELINTQKQIEMLKPQLESLEESMNNILQKEKIYKNNDKNLDDWFFSKTYLKGNNKEDERKKLINIYLRDSFSFKDEITKFDLLHLNHYKENRRIMKRDLDILNSRWEEYKSKKNEQENTKLDLNYDYIIENKEYRLIPPSSMAYQYVEEYIRMNYTFEKLTKDFKEKKQKDINITEKILSLKKVYEN
jgi:hypothetical protein